ncbi:MAG: hypothetical protein AB7S26_31810 [Sandaracinaceae bacterium]
MHRRSLSVVAMSCVITLVGCFDAHGGRDGSTDDAGRDGAIAPSDASSGCPPRAGYELCGELCEGGSCGEGARCAGELSVCLPEVGRFDCDISLVSTSPERSPDARYCPRADFCAIPVGWPQSAERTAGLCVDLAYCEEVAPELGISCRYSDGTRVIDGPPPLSACPDDAGVFPYCGGPCGACPEFVVGHVPFTACAGMNEERGFGVCAWDANDTCARDDISPHPCLPSPPGPFDEACVCLTLRRETGEFAEVGFTVYESSCRAYRGHFPDDVECNDIFTWEPIP